MAIKQINKSEWSAYFDQFSKNYLKDEQPEYAEIMVLSETVGAQPETGWLLLKGITFDAKNDLVEVQVEKLDHMIVHPVEIYIDELDNGEIASIEIVTKDGTKEIIEIR